jgi:hypothetical protein
MKSKEESGLDDEGWFRWRGRNLIKMTKLGLGLFKRLTNWLMVYWWNELLVHFQRNHCFPYWSSSESKLSIKWIRSFLKGWRKELTELTKRLSTPEPFRPGRVPDFLGRLQPPRRWFRIRTAVASRSGFSGGCRTPKVRSRLKKNREESSINRMCLMGAPRNTKGEVSLPLTSCLTDLD